MGKIIANFVGCRMTMISDNIAELEELITTQSLTKDAHDGNLLIGAFGDSKTSWSGP